MTSNLPESTVPGAASSSSTTDSGDSGAAGARASPKTISVGEFLDHCSKFFRSHRLLVLAVVSAISAIAVASFAAGYWTRMIEGATGDSNTELAKISDNLTFLSETSQTNFDGDSYFFAAVADLLESKNLIGTADAQRLQTGVFIYQFQKDKGDFQDENSIYVNFANSIRSRYHVAKTSGFYNPVPDRGIILSKELDGSIVCEIVRAAVDNGLGLKFVVRARATQGKNRDRYSIHVNASMGDVEGATEQVRTEMDIAKSGCIASGYWK